MGRIRSDIPPAAASRHCEERSDEATHSSFTRPDGLLRGVRHRARICATRWLAMTVFYLQCEAAIPRCEAPGSCQSFRPKITEGAGKTGCRLHPQPRVR